MKHPQDKHENTQRLKLMLLAGQVLTKRYLDRLFDVTNSAEMAMVGIITTSGRKTLLPFFVLPALITIQKFYEQRT
jgi:hypothetical protein